MKKIKWIALTAAVVMTVTMSLTACGGGNTGGSTETKTNIQLTIGAGHVAEGMVYTRGARDFFCTEVSKRVAENTDYEITWIDAYGGSIAKMAEILSATEKGILDVGLPCYPFLSSDLLPHNICYFTPFTSPDAEVIGDAMKELYAEFPVFTSIFEDHNQVYLGTGYAGNYQLITKKPVEKLSDIDGVKIAAAGPNLNWLKGTKAVPVQDEMNNAYTSIQNGVYDGWIMFSDSNKNFKLYEVAKYQATVDFGAVAVCALTMNTDRFNSLPEEVQAIFVEVGAEYTDYEMKLANSTALTAEQDMVDAGLTVTVFPEDQREAWANLLPNLPEEYVKQMDAKGYPGNEIMTRYLELLEEGGYKLPRNWF